MKFSQNDINKEVNYQKAKAMTIQAFKKYYRIPDKNVNIIVDPTKEKVADIFQKIKEKATAFSENNNRLVLSVLIRWIGWDVELSRCDATITTNDESTIEIKSLKGKIPSDGKTEAITF